MASRLKEKRAVAEWQNRSRTISSGGVLMGVGITLKPVPLAGTTRFGGKPQVTHARDGSIEKPTPDSVFRYKEPIGYPQAPFPLLAVT